MRSAQAIVKTTQLKGDIFVFFEELSLHRRMRTFVFGLASTLVLALPIFGQASAQGEGAAESPQASAKVVQSDKPERQTPKKPKDRQPKDEAQNKKETSQNKAPKGKESSAPKKAKAPASDSKQKSTTTQKTKAPKFSAENVEKRVVRLKAASLQFGDGNPKTPGDDDREYCNSLRAHFPIEEYPRVYFWHQTCNAFRFIEMNAISKASSYAREAHSVFIELSTTVSPEKSKAMRDILGRMVPYALEWITPCQDFSVIPSTTPIFDTWIYGLLEFPDELLQGRVKKLIAYQLALRTISKGRAPPPLYTPATPSLKSIAKSTSRPLVRNCDNSEGCETFDLVGGQWKPNISPFTQVDESIEQANTEKNENRPEQALRILMNYYQTLSTKSVDTFGEKVIEGVKDEDNDPANTLLKIEPSIEKSLERLSKEIGTLKGSGEAKEELTSESNIDIHDLVLAFLYAELSAESLLAKHNDYLKDIVMNAELIFEKLLKVQSVEELSYSPDYWRFQSLVKVLRTGQSFDTRAKLVRSQGQHAFLSTLFFREIASTKGTLYAEVADTSLKIALSDRILARGYVLDAASADSIALATLTKGPASPGLTPALCRALR